MFTSKIIHRVKTPPQKMNHSYESIEVELPQRNGTILRQNDIQEKNDKIVRLKRGGFNLMKSLLKKVPKIAKRRENIKLAAEAAYFPKGEEEEEEFAQKTIASLISSVQYIINWFIQKTLRSGSFFTLYC